MKKKWSFLAKWRCPKSINNLCYPNMSFALLYNSAAAGTFWASFPIPTAWAPWDIKNNTTKKHEAHHKMMFLWQKKFWKTLEWINALCSTQGKSLFLHKAPPIFSLSCLRQKLVSQCFLVLNSGIKIKHLSSVSHHPPRLQPLYWWDFPLHTTISFPSVFIIVP